MSVLTEAGGLSGSDAEPGHGKTPKTLPTIFEETADARPDALAVTFGSESMTYSELEDAADFDPEFLTGFLGYRRLVVAGDLHSLADRHGLPSRIPMYLNTPIGV